MIRVTVLGYGNVGSHLVQVFLNHPNIDLVQVYNRTLNPLSKLKGLVSITNKLSDLANSDIFIISISDDKISELSEQLKNFGNLIVHTSGSVEMNAILSERKGVFYPLQSFTKNKQVNFKEIPICIESNSNDDLIVLEKLASLITDHSYILDSEKRKKMHLAAVFVNNFVNHLYHIGHSICEENEVPFEILHPLMGETLEKVKSIIPFDAQTGPARRNDSDTIRNQLEQLEQDQQKIYKKLTNSITNTYTDK